MLTVPLGLDQQLAAFGVQDGTGHEVVVHQVADGAGDVGGGSGSLAGQGGEGRPGAGVTS